MLILMWSTSENFIKIGQGKLMEKIIVCDSVGGPGFQNLASWNLVLDSREIVFSEKWEAWFRFHCPFAEMNEEVMNFSLLQT